VTTHERDRIDMRNSPGWDWFSGPNAGSMGTFRCRKKQHMWARRNV